MWLFLPCPHTSTRAKEFPVKCCSIWTYILPLHIWFINSTWYQTFPLPDWQNQLDMTCDAAMNPTKMSAGFCAEAAVAEKWADNTTPALVSYLYDVHYGISKGICKKVNNGKPTPTQTTNFSVSGIFVRAFVTLIYLKRCGHRTWMVNSLEPWNGWGQIRLQW